MKIFKITLFFLAINNIFGLVQTNLQFNHEGKTEELKKHLNILGSDLFEGRGTGTEGGRLAAEYLSEEFAELGLSPLGSNGTFHQYIPMHGSYPKDESELILCNDDNNSNNANSLKLFEEYILLTGGDQTFTPTPLPLVFCGYGIIAPEFDYNDYQSVDVEGKIVVVLEGEPNSTDNNYFEAELPTIYSNAEAKKRLAISRGAAGIIIIPTLFYDPLFSWEQVIKNYSFESVSLAYSATSILSILFNPKYADLLFVNSSYSFDDVIDLHHSNSMSSFPLKRKLSFKGEFLQRDFVASNIIGLIEGKDDQLKDSYIVVSAHYDHLGIGPAVEADSIYNGVMDNAIGVAALLEIASSFNAGKIKPKRSIIFALFTGEEKGLLGSRYYVDHPPVPLYKTIANVNIDGIAVFDKFKSIVGIGAEFSTLSDFLKQTAAQNDLVISEIPNIFMSSEAFISSDQISFANVGVPSILIYEGLDYENLTKEEGIAQFIDYNNNYYHTPKDDLSFDINYEAAIQHVKILQDFILNLANSCEAPEWYENSPFINERLRSIAEKR
ncbi:MAG: M20/M25/M40 family metallo-hydrolase [Melioribacteraceae bacterium]|nr:M20/M25/M40 family metallo-hydrolase [Melioribacteraceae bacterium]